MELRSKIIVHTKALLSWRVLSRTGELDLLTQTVRAEYKNTLGRGKIASASSEMTLLVASIRILKLID